MLVEKSCALLANDRTPWKMARFYYVIHDNVFYRIVGNARPGLKYRVVIYVIVTVYSSGPRVNHR